MAVEFDVIGSRTSEYRFLPEFLEVHPELNGRHETLDIEPLIQSILTRGQLQPVTIRRAEKSLYSWPVSRAGGR